MHLPIAHIEDAQRQGFFIERDGATVARMTYRRAGPHLIVIEHTEVDPALAGQGVGRRLLDTLVQWARQSGTQVASSCSYAIAQFQRDASLQDVAAPLP